MDAVASIVEQVRAAHAAGEPLRIRGGGSKDFYGEAATGTLLETTALAGNADHEPTELVVTDLIMPEKEGIETMTALRATDPTVKVIAISGLTPRSAFYLQLATKFGADLTLPKPFTLDALSKAINQVLAKPHP